MTTIEKLEQIVEHNMTGRISYKQLISPAPTPVNPVGRITRAAAWGIFILFLTVPLLAAAAHRASLLWGLWALVSLWATVDSRTIGAALSSPNRPVVAGRFLVLGLAAWNVFIATCAMFLPSIPLW